jgi:2-oxoisovalerate dehydrogenase E1 component
MKSSLEEFYKLAENAPDLYQSIPDEMIHQALLIREVETTFLELFSQGRMNGTVHTCVGQELSAVAVAGQLEPGDWVTSNHRCHGHFIAKTGNWRGLVDELMGLKSGVCMGIGSSQHLYAKGFLSNGPQASLVPVASGIALYNKRQRNGAISASFIGEGTLGEGVLYESLNIAALWGVPQLIVCENNLYSQSTAQGHGVAGSIRGRADAFGIQYFEADTWNTKELLRIANQAIAYVRNEGKPAFLTVRTYRLNAHSKSDDDRQEDEVAYFRGRDPLNRLIAGSESWRSVQASIKSEIDAHIVDSSKIALAADSYVFDQLPRDRDSVRLEIRNEKVRMSHALNRAYHGLVAEGAYMIGEDILDPYGGAFKVTKGLSSRFPEQVLGTPISEAAIVGVGIGLSIMGSAAYVEIMFGDFVTNIFDQLISNASKFFHMYAFQISVPVRVRTPMGGKRGYGPTHSQSLEKHLVGIDNIAVFALTSLEDPGAALTAIHELPAPAIIIESKVDYGRHLWQGNPDYGTAKAGGALGTIVLSPLRRKANVTVAAYGDTAREIADQLKEIFLESDCVVELVVPISIHPLDLKPVLESARQTGLIVVVEDGSVAFGIGSEMLTQLCEILPGLVFARVGAEPVPVPSILALEKDLLPSVRKLVAALLRVRATVEAQS